MRINSIPLRAFAIAGLLLTALHGWALAQPAKEGVAMQVRVNFVASATGCSIEPFVASPAAPPAVGTTICAIGGPFGAGMVGIGLPAGANLAGATIHLDRTFTFNSGADTISIKSVFNAIGPVEAGSGGVRHFNGTWQITEGTGAFKGLRGEGQAFVALTSVANVPPPPQIGREELVGWVMR